VQQSTLGLFSAAVHGLGTARQLHRLFLSLVHAKPRVSAGCDAYLGDHLTPARSIVCHRSHEQKNIYMQRLCIRCNTEEMPTPRNRCSEKQRDLVPTTTSLRRGQSCSVDIYDLILVIETTQKSRRSISVF
jgi:hypothetical protein